MCRSIRVLREGQEPAPEEEIRAAALQYIRKVSGFRRPSRVNTEPFDRAVDQVAAVTEELLGNLVVRGAKHNPSS